MLPLQFLGQNLHFAISLFAALVFFAVFWLYFDAWTAQRRKSRTDLYIWGGFLLASISFLVQATVIEQSVLGKSIFGEASQTVATLLRVAGYALIVAGQLLGPLQKKPHTQSIEAELTQEQQPAVPAVAATSSFGLAYILPAGALAIAALYYRRATQGLEKHLRPVAYAFALLFVFELLSLASLGRGTDNLALYNLLKAFGPLWLASQLFLLAGVLVLGRWVWHYLTERFMSQLFMEIGRASCRERV